MSRLISRLRPRRAMLYCPDLKKIQKAVGLNVDSICMDLEDAVALNAKADARKHVVEALNTVNFAKSERIVRINAVGTGLEEDDLRAILSAKNLPDAFLVPKVDNADQLRWVGSQIDKLTSSIKTPDGQPASSAISLLALIESAQSMINLPSITAADPRLVALIFGADDYAADVGATRSECNGPEVQFARSWVHLHAAAARLQSIDMVQTRFTQPALLEAECLAAAAMGYTGKQVIHPAQVEVAQRLFTPTPELVAYSRRVIEAFRASVDGDRKGALQLDGQMVDTANVKVAQSILARAGIHVDL